MGPPDPPSPVRHDPASRHRLRAARFAEHVAAVRDWDAPTPVEGWVARDVVRHLLEWFPGFLASGTGLRLPQGPAVDADPLRAWAVHTDGVQSLLEDPSTAATTFQSARLPPQRLAEVIDRFYTADVFMHTWDLAVATGQDVSLDAAYCAELLEEMTAMEDVIRRSGQFGTRVEVSPAADVESQLLGFIGRDPAWRPGPTVRP